MKVENHDRGRIVPLIPATEQSVKIVVQPGVDGGIAVSIDVSTDSLGDFTIPLNKWQLGTIAAMANWLLKLNPEQITQLRVQLVREHEERNNP